MKHKHREVSRRQPIQAPESESGLDEKQEEAKDESRQQKGPWEERKERQREMRWGGVKKGWDVKSFFMFLQCNFTKVIILHIDYRFGIHILWLTRTNNSLCLGFHWMKM